MDTQNNKKTGFTIVELVIVITVIGILAAISVAGYGSWRFRVAKNEVKTDLSSVFAAMESKRNFANAYPVQTANTDLDTIVFKPSTNVTTKYISGSGNSYCIEGRSKYNTGIVYFLMNTQKDPRPGTCAGGEISEDSLPLVVPPTYEEVIAVNTPSLSCPFDMTTRTGFGVDNNVPCMNDALYITFKDANSASASYTVNQPGPSSSIKSVRFDTAPGSYYIEHQGGGGNSIYSNYNVNNWSVDVWVKFNSGATDRAIVSAQDLWGMRTTSNGFACDRRVGSPWATATAASSAPIPATGVWYHVACTYNSGVLKLYVNGAERASNTGVNNANSGGGRLVLGNQGNMGGNGFLDGWLTELNFYKGTTLTSGEILQRYNYLNT